MNNNRDNFPDITRSDVDDNTVSTRLKLLRAFAALTDFEYERDDELGTMLLRTSADSRQVLDLLKRHGRLQSLQQLLNQPAERHSGRHSKCDVVGVIKLSAERHQRGVFKELDSVAVLRSSSSTTNPS